MLGARLYGEIRNLQFEKQFERDFMRRTLKLVQEYQGAYDATLLLKAIIDLDEVKVFVEKLANHVEKQIKE